MDRFELVEPFLKSKRYEPWIRCAIDGHVFDPFVTTRKNGTLKAHNGWDLLFRDAAHFEEACRKAPLESRPEVEQPEPEPPAEPEAPTLPGL